MLKVATHFLEEEFPPRIKKRVTKKRPIHVEGWSLSYHGSTSTGKLVRASIYEETGQFAQSLVARAVYLVRFCYPPKTINDIVGATLPGALKI